MTSNNPAGNARTQPDQHLAITRQFDASPEEVFSAWTERERTKRWWGPRGFETPLLEMDLRPHGEWRAMMRAPDGKAYPQKGVFREIQRPRRLAFTFKWVNEADPESLVTVELFERDGKTEMTFRQNFFRSRESRDSHEEGWNESFDRLAHELSQAGPGKAPVPPAKPGPAHRKLGVFVGRWNGAGQAMPDAPLPGKMIVADSYE